MRVDKNSFILDSAIRKNRPFPEWYLTEPQLLPGEDFYISAFYRLSTERAVGMSFGPIPWFARIKYAELHGLEGPLIEYFADVIGYMDGKYTAWQQEQAEIQRQANS